jgi:hypothetical protein
MSKFLAKAGAVERSPAWRIFQVAAVVGLSIFFILVLMNPNKKI